MPKLITKFFADRETAKLLMQYPEVLGRAVPVESDDGYIFSSLDSTIVTRCQQFLDNLSRPKPIQTVWVTVWEHKYGIDSSVFSSQELAEGYRQSIADEWWDKEMEGMNRPDDRALMADEYFAYMSELGKEKFYISEKTIDPPSQL